MSEDEKYQLPPPAINRLDYIDALRGLAILGVIYFHCSLYAGGNIRGQIYANAAAYGVQLFFMVSAFTIFLTLERAKMRERHFIRNFFIRRLFRILPMFWIGIMIYSFVPMRQPTAPPIVVTISDYLLTALCLHGFHPFTINSVVPGGWTIAVETTFYFSTLILFSFIKNWKGAAAFLLATLIILKAASSLLNYLYYHHIIWTEVSASVFGNFAYSWFPNQLPIFACGILTFFVSCSLPDQFLTKRTGILLLVIAAMSLQGAIGIGNHGFIPIPETLYFSIGFLFLFLGLKCHPTNLLVNPFTKLLGKISYSGYLLHFGMLFMSLQILHHYFEILVPLPDINTLVMGGLVKDHPAAHQTVRFALLFLTTVAFTIPASWLTYKFIEGPFISLGSRLVKYSESRHSKTEKIIAFPNTVENQRPVV